MQARRTITRGTAAAGVDPLGKRRSSGQLLTASLVGAVLAAGLIGCSPTGDRGIPQDLPPGCTQLDYLAFARGYEDAGGDRFQPTHEAFLEAAACATSAPVPAASTSEAPQPPAAAADAAMDNVAEELRYAYVYRESGGDIALTRNEMMVLGDSIAATGWRFFIAILPPEAITAEYPTTGAVLTALQDRIGEPGIYAVTVGDDFEAAATGTDVDVNAVGQRILSKHGDKGMYFVLDAFVNDVAQRLD